MEFLIKAIIGGIIVASVVSAAQRGNPTIGALILGIPLGTIISLVFMHYGGGIDPATFAKLAKETVYFVVVSLIFFPVFSYMILNYNFWTAISAAIALTLICLYGLLLYLKS
ncbi:hypothetical protein N8072_00940 [bacterium]|nr:hypothetical protein [bacterium]MDB4128739.1 hypothetical protein [bacterium]MDC1257226.1 hypothetical protein [bacterium]